MTYREPAPQSEPTTDEERREADERRAGQSSEALWRLVRSAQDVLMRRYRDEFIRQHPTGVAYADPKVVDLAQAMLRRR